MNNNKKKALAKFLECGVSEIEDSRHDDDGAEYGRAEYLVLTDSEADRKAKEYILDSVWAFNTSFLQYHLKGDLEQSDIKRIQERCENANPTLISLLEDEGAFVDDAISSDGRGHFLSSYDGEENEVMVGKTWYYIYRTN